MNRKITQRIILSLIGFMLMGLYKVNAQAPTISSFSPTSGSIGTLVTINGTNLSATTAINIGGVAAIKISATNSNLVAMVMPGATTGLISINTGIGNATGIDTFTISASQLPSIQQGNKLVGTSNDAQINQGISLCVSGDGNTAIVGGYNDNYYTGAVWIYTRTGSTWSQQGSKLVGTGAVGSAYQGSSVSISADGNTAIVGGYRDNGNIGTAWVFTRSGSTWSQQGNKLVGTGAIGQAQIGQSVSISADGNTAIIGGYSDNNSIGAVWVFTRNGSTWTQQGGKLVGSGNIGPAFQGTSVSISGDGNTAIVGGNNDNGGIGAAWIFTRNGSIWSQQGNKLVGTGNLSTSQQGYSVSISADGNTTIVGGFYDSYDIGAAWIFTKNGNTWSQQGNKLVGTGYIGPTRQGQSVSLSADGNTAIVGGYYDNNNIGAAWIFTRSGSTWSQQGGKLVGVGSVGSSKQGYSVSLSADGNTTLVGGFADNNNIGATWVYTQIGNTWSQQGNKLIGAGAVGSANQGVSVSLSADGNTAIVGGSADNNYTGAAWVYTRNGNTWSQQGNKLVGTGAVGAARQGTSVCLSADGNTAIVGGNYDNNYIGAAWVYTRNGSTWSQQGSKLVGTGALGTARQGASVSISADGNTAIVGGDYYASGCGAVWVYTRSGGTWSQQGNKLVGTGPIGNAHQGSSVSLSADGNTAIVGGSEDNGNNGAAWIFTRNGSTWSQQGSKLTDTSVVGPIYQGRTVAISADGNTAILGSINIRAAWVYNRSGGTWSQQGTKLAVTGFIGSGYAGINVTISADGNIALLGGSGDNTNIGAAWVFTRNGSIWSQQGAKLVGTGAIGSAWQGGSVSISPDGNTAIMGGNNDNIDIGAAWAFTPPAINATSQFNKFTKCIGSVPVQQSFTVSGIGLTDNLVVSAPIGFEVSTTSGSGFGNTVSLTPAAGSVNSTTIYIRLISSASGSPSGNVVCSSTGLPNKIIAVSGLAGAPTTSTVDITICSSTLPSFTWNGRTYNTAKTDTVILTNASGCDSVAILKLSVKLSSTTTRTISICPSELPYYWNGRTYNAAKTDTLFLTNAIGCDSLVILNLDVKSISISTKNISICPDGLPYTWNGRTYNTAKTDTVYFTNSSGCDSMAVLNLKVKSISTSINNVSICPNQLPYTWNGLSFTGAGTQTKTGLINAAQCDSSATLNLSVKSTSMSTSNLSICSSQLPYIWNGLNFTGAGSKTKTGLINSVGCDSSATLNLTVKSSSSSTNNLSVCPSQLPYTWNGLNFTGTGSKTKTGLVNSVGCDSSATLNLTVKSTINSINNFSICTSELPYTWNGLIFVGSDTKTKTGLISAAGCDSSATLILTVNSTPNTGNIIGLSNLFKLDTASYSVNGSQGSTYNWSVTKGIIQSGAGANQIQIKWNAIGTDTLKVTETSSQGCVGLQNTLVVNVSPTSGINEINASNKIIIYPNPTTGMVNISSSQAIDNIEVFDVTGKLVLSHRNDTHQKHIELDLSAFSNGIYFIQTHNQNAEKTLNKVVISK